MKSVKVVSVWLMMAMLLVTPLRALAWPGEGFYLGVGIGQASYDVNRDYTINHFVGLDQTTTFDDKAVAAKFAIGFRFDPVLAFTIEMLGADDVIAMTNGSNTRLFDLSAANVLLEAQLPMSERLALVGKFGGSFWSVGQNSGAYSMTLEDGVGLAYGVGLDLSIAENAGRVIRLEWQRMDLGGLHLSAVDMANVSLVFNFDFSSSYRRGRGRGRY